MANKSAEQIKAEEQYNKLINDLNSLAKSSQVVDNANTTRYRTIGGVPTSGQFGAVRNPWVMTTTQWLLDNPKKAIIWAANPSEASWTMSQRKTMEKNLGGTVTHAWPNLARSTYYDEFKIGLSLQTNNIMPVLSKDGKWDASQGLSNFYQLIQLLDAPILTTDGRANLVSIKYSSNIFPDLTLFGQFDPTGIKFTDSSNSPNQIASISVDFTVFDSVPRLSTNGSEDNAQILLNAYVAGRIKNDPTLNSQSIATATERIIPTLPVSSVINTKSNV